ncbi:MAG: MBL fold metallo-hydrolase [Hyphomicrobiales bacterium]|nr:MBL fold metallo-hydrolase [Hyphomicrobiales bacterium]
MRHQAETNRPITTLGSTMRVLRPYANVFAFYDGRVEGKRAYSEEKNWLDDGAYVLGIATYAIVEGSEALVYDTHISLPHARAIRESLTTAGVTRFRVVLSHWHADHVAGNEIFADCEIIANELTAKALTEHRQEFEEGGRNPAIKPLVMPNRFFDRELTLRVGSTVVELRHADIHSHDGTVMLLAKDRVLFAGDTLEDPITYVAEPDRLEAHLVDLERMSGWDFDRILPNHGAPEVIASGGYDRRFIDSTRRYVEKLLRCKQEPQSAAQDLGSFVAADLASGAIRYFAPYEAVHRRNVEAVIAGSGR